MGANAFAEFDRFRQEFIEELKMLADEEETSTAGMQNTLKTNRIR